MLEETQDIEILNLAPHTAVAVSFRQRFSFPSSCLCPSLMAQIMPIYELVRFSTAADHVGARLANMQRGWDEYLQQFDSCRCAPCRYNGIPVLMGTSCKCVCKSGYHGEACEETLRRGETFVVSSGGKHIQTMSLNRRKYTLKY